ncbi:chloride channel protein [Gardnerella vaginalis]|uniref:Chemotaxis protein n=1 Tax=Gardnerella vaginalis TaxID=2702 RepID=A0A2K1SW73_GARVA|nr:chloride channel protein [Gardnerella vaginalis]PNS43783.1 chemotaxis protein [Gardnerella vaginalis]
MKSTSKTNATNLSCNSKTALFRFINFAFLILSVIFIGIITGLGATALTFILYAVQYLAFGSIESAKNTVFSELPWYRYVLSCTIAMTIASIAWYFLRKRENPPRIVTIPQAVDGSNMPIFSTIAHVLLQIGIVGSGISIGREVAPRELASMIAQRYSSIFHISAKTQRVLIASAAGAGLSAVYHAPLAGTVLALGLLSKTQGLGFYAWLNRENGPVEVNVIKNISRSERLYCLPFALVMNYIATLVVEFLMHHSSYYNISQFSCAISWQICALAVVVGAACGLVGYVFRLGIIWCRTHALRGVKMLCFMPVAGLVIGIAACWFPHIMGNGRSLSQFAFSMSSFPYAVDSSNIMIILLLLAMMKMFMTLLVLRCGASGGVLQPSISTGACIGLIVGVISIKLPLIGSAISNQPNVLIIAAIFGAASLLTASRKSLWFALLLVAQLVNVPLIMIIPMVIACAAACAAAQSIMLLSKTFSRK